MNRKLLAALNKVLGGDTLDLTDFDNAKEWVKENANDVYYELDEDDEEYDDHARAEDERADERVYEYMDKYSEVVNKTSIEVYRAVCLKDIKNLNIEKIGTHWSFEKGGVGCYGGGEYLGKEERDGKMYVLTGIANTKDIAWEYGLTSYMYYGADQWECALNEGSDITITHIDDKKLDKPIKGKI